MVEKADFAAAPFVKALENKRRSEITPRLNSYKRKTKSEEPLLAPARALALAVYQYRDQGGGVL
jgi:hypothetical protein